MNYGMIATGNHVDFDSLRGAPPHRQCVTHCAGRITSFGRSRPVVSFTRRMKFDNLKFGRAQVGTLAHFVKILRALPVSEGWYIGGGVFVKSPLLCRLLLVLFLPKQEKYVIPPTVRETPIYRAVWNRQLIFLDKTGIII